MLEFFRNNPFVVGALSGSLAAYLLGLVISHFRREKRWLGYQVASRNVVRSGHTKISVRYEGREVHRIDSHAITLRNIGNRPLTNLPVSLVLEGSGTIIEFEVNVPEGSNTTASLDGTTKVAVRVDLLNPGESIQVGLTIADGNEARVRVVARAELLELRELSSASDLLEFIQALALSVPVLGSINLALSRVGRRTQGK